MKEFEGKVALVTGGGSGIGRATALAFARDGARVVIGNRNVQRGEETVSMIRAAGGTASFRRTDVLVAADIEALVKHAVSEYGGLDLAFNNAGIEGEVRPLVTGHSLLVDGDSLRSEDYSQSPENTERPTSNAECSKSASIVTSFAKASACQERLMMRYLC
jgi:NAD(P)-dependent dehydrogenase (short-subunit alcohol dehydrogenase family)